MLCLWARVEFTTRTNSTQTINRFISSLVGNARKKSRVKSVAGASIEVFLFEHGKKSSCKKVKPVLLSCSLLFSWSNFGSSGKEKQEQKAIIKKLFSSAANIIRWPIQITFFRCHDRVWRSNVSRHPEDNTSGIDYTSMCHSMSQTTSCSCFRKAKCKAKPKMKREQSNSCNCPFKFWGNRAKTKSRQNGKRLRSFPFRSHKVRSVDTSNYLSKGKVHSLRIHWLTPTGHFTFLLAILKLFVNSICNPISILSIARSDDWILISSRDSRNFTFLIDKNAFDEGDL